MWFSSLLNYLFLISIVPVIQSLHSKNCTNCSYEGRSDSTIHKLFRRVKRAEPAVCSSSPSNTPHSLVERACCDGTMPLFIDNQLSTNDGMGAISRAIQLRIQSRFNTSFEVIISESDFVVNTYYTGPRQCKFETDRYFVALYETPVQYDITNTALENRLAGVDSRDPLGWKEAPFVGGNEVLDIDGATEVKPALVRGEGGDAEVQPTQTRGEGGGGSASQSATCSQRSSGAATSYLFMSNECCDARLSLIMVDATERSIATPHLGDAAKYIQRRIQLEYSMSFEVLMSKGNFAVSTHYRGMRSCKIREGEYYILAYATPVQYDPFNIAEEDLLASTDSEEPLGSTRYTNLRGDRPDVRVEPSAGENLSLQPEPSQSRARIYEGAGGAGAAMDLEDINVGGNRTLGTVTSRDSLDLPPGTHCNKMDRTGDMCCSSKLFETMTDVFYELSSSPQFSYTSAGNIASLIQRRAQRRFQQSFEVIVSTNDFSLASYMHGDFVCKYRERGFVAAAYATPVQYDITQTAAEAYYSSISSRDRLGATQPFLPGQRSFHTPLAVNAEGPRAGLPVGSHCGTERAGSRCCSVSLFNVMQSSYESAISRPDFDPYDTRILARTIQWNAEEMLQHSVEAVVSTDDFAYSSSYMGDNVCKFRIDRYYIMTYATPVPYPIHSEFFEDSGPATPINCPAQLSALDGAVCCDGTVRYELNRALDEVLLRPEEQRDNTALARAIQAHVERRFGTRFESVASRGDFVWRTNLYSENTCKIDRNGYHLLTFESSKLPPPVEELLEAAAPPQTIGQIGVPPAALQPPGALPPLAQPPVQPPPPPLPAPPVAPPPGVGPPPFVPPQVPPAPFVLPQVPPAPFAPPQVPPAIFAAPPVPPAFAFEPPVPQAYGSGGSCFSTDTWVTTPSGKKRMDELKVGDFVLTANLTSAYFTPISLWIHREPDVMTKFVTIMTDYGKMLALTARHLIFRNKCGEFYEDRVSVLPPNSKAVYAEELEVGDCVFLLYKNRFRQQRLQDISITTRRGVFSPLTPNGRIIVNDMLASCYSDLNEATLQTTYFYVDLPFGSEFSTELVRLIVPYVK